MQKCREISKNKNHSVKSVSRLFSGHVERDAWGKYHHLTAEREQSAMNSVRCILFFQNSVLTGKRQHCSSDGSLL